MEYNEVTHECDVTSCVSIMSQYTRVMLRGLGYTLYHWRQVKLLDLQAPFLEGKRCIKKGVTAHPVVKHAQVEWYVGLTPLLPPGTNVL